MIIEVDVPGQENEQSWTCLSVFILLLSTIFQSDLLNCSDSVVCFPFYDHVIVKMLFLSFKKLKNLAFNLTG